MSICNNNQQKDNTIPLEMISSCSNKKSMELFEENENDKPPLSKFLNQIINFHSIMPSSKEMNEKLETTANTEVILFLNISFKNMQLELILEKKNLFFL
jgi:hypothetical protein